MITLAVLSAESFIPTVQSNQFVAPICRVVFDPSPVKVRMGKGLNATDVTALKEDLIRQYVVRLLEVELRPIFQDIFKQDMGPLTFSWVTCMAGKKWMVIPAELYSHKYPPNSAFIIKLADLIYRQHDLITVTRLVERTRHFPGYLTLKRVSDDCIT